MATKQIKIPKFDVDYDDYADVLYISFGKPKEGIVCEVAEGDLVRVDPYTDKIVGITILDFKNRYLGTGNDIKASAKAVLPGILKNFKSCIH
ncbi:MAG: DUF2283 domain-containing protein [Proteobacteria bacterium]|nr:DUF2283 domain-containing protein [Pseudomonadota bacterium]